MPLSSAQPQDGKEQIHFFGSLPSQLNNSPPPLALALARARAPARTDSETKGSTMASVCGLSADATGRDITLGRAIILYSL
jgi:hypothetical protein